MVDPRLPGRPSFVWSLEKSNKIKVMFAAGYEAKEIAPVVGCCLKTFRKVFTRECAERKVAERKLRAAVLVGLVGKAVAGDTSAAKAVLPMIERERAKVLSERMTDKARRAVQAEVKAKAEPKAAPIGKKEAATVAARDLEGMFAVRAAPTALQN